MTSKVLRQFRQSWSIIVLCYNEKAAVRNTVEKVGRVLSKIAGTRYEIIVVDDGSTDGSTQIIREMARKTPKVKGVYHPINRGIGDALQSGYSTVRNENVCAIAGDGQFDPRELLPFKTLGEKTFVSLYRKKQVGYSLFRRALSAANRVINRVLLGIKLEDVNWVKIYKLKELSQLDLRLRSSLIESEICAKLFLRGNHVIEVPSVYHQRTGGRARGGSLKIVWKALLETSKLAWVVWSYRLRLSR